MGESWAKSVTSESFGEFCMLSVCMDISFISRTGFPELSRT